MEYFSSVSKARLLIDSGRISEAMKILKPLISENPNDADLHALIAICHSRSGDHKLALEEAKSALGISPDDSFNHYVLSSVYFQMGSFSESEKAIREALSLYPGNDVYLYLLAASLYNRENYKAAYEIIMQGLAANPTNKDLLNLKASCLVNLGDRDEATKAILNSLREDPEDADGLATKGWLNLDSGNTKKAKEDFVSALKIDPAHERAKEGLLEIYKLDSWIFNFIIRNSFRKFFYEISWWTVLVAIVFIKTIPLWFFMFSIYLLVGWYLSVLLNSIFRLGSRSKYLLSKSQILQSNIFICLNIFIVVSFIGADFFESDKMIRLGLFFIAALFMSIGTVELNFPASRKNSIIGSVFLLGLLTYIITQAQGKLIYSIIATVVIICIYGLAWSLRIRNKLSVSGIK